VAGGVELNKKPQKPGFFKKPQKPGFFKKPGFLLFQKTKNRVS
jgi:hypothetical protein